MEQGTPEWLAARCGKLTASRIADAAAKTKTGWGASRSNLMAELLVERLTGSPTAGYESSAMAWGRENEAYARAAYEFYRDCSVELVGLIDHPRITMAAASPDGLVGGAGLVEFKCPNSATHIDTLLSSTIDGRYITQIQWQMACTGRVWCDYCSFDPRLPERLRLFVKRVPRDNARISELEALAEDFLREVSTKELALAAMLA